MLLGLHISM